MLWAVIMVIALGFLYLVRGILLPFVLAFALAAILDPLVRRLQSRRWPRPVATVSVLAVFFGSLIAIGVWLTPVISGQVVGFKEGAEELVAGFAQPDEDANFFVRWNPVVIERQSRSRDFLDTVLESNSATLERLGLPSTKRAIYAQYVEPQRGQIQKTLEGFLQGIVGIASGLLSQVLILLFVPILTIPILLSLDSMKLRLYGIIPPGIRPTIVALFEDIGKIFSKYLRGVSIAVLGYMALMAGLLSVLGAPYGLLLGFLFGLVYLVPYFNVVICASTLALVTMISGTKSGPLLHMDGPVPFTLTLLGIYLVVHFTYDSIVYPQMVGRAVGLDPIVSMFVIFSGGALFGVPGMILAFPFAGSVKVVLGRLIGVTNRVDEITTLPIIPERHRAAADVG